jgi:hypothetical protein
MPRTTDAAVKEIIDTALNCMPFIMTASILVTNYLGAVGYAEPHLAEIERWWAAHLVTIREPRPHQVKLGESTVTFVEGDLGKNLESSFYGQTVLSLDTDGVLREVVAAVEAGIKYATFDVL